MFSYPSMIENSMIESISLEIGGGNGYWFSKVSSKPLKIKTLSSCRNSMFWCSKCNYFYHEKPLMCYNKYNTKTINESKIIKIIQDLDLENNIDEQIIKTYLTNPKQCIKEIDELFKRVINVPTYEEAIFGTTYDNLMELIENRYEKEIYNVDECTCNNKTFVKEERKGTFVEKFSGEQLDVFNHINKSK